jgi:hypothetical protein
MTKKMLKTESEFERPSQIILKLAFYKFGEQMIFYWKTTHHIPHEFFMKMMQHKIVSGFQIQTACALCGSIFESGKSIWSFDKDKTVLFLKEEGYEIVFNDSERIVFQFIKS